MTDYGTIKIPREEYERHNDRRQDLGLTWAEYLDGQAPDQTGANGDEIERLREIVDTIPERTADELEGSFR